MALGLGSLVYGFSLAEQGWGSIDTIGFLALGVGLLALFVFIESRVAQPVLPLRVILHRVRGGAFLIQAIVGSVLIGATLYVTFYFQIVLGMRPLVAGVANVAMTVVILIVVPLLTKALPAIGPRPMMVFGPLFVPLQNVALTGVAPHDAGAASATVNAATQIGGSVGLSVFTAIYAGASAGSMSSGSPQLAAFTDGYSSVFVAAAITMVAASLIAVFLIRGTKSELLPQEGQTAAVHMG